MDSPLKGKWKLPVIGEVPKPVVIIGLGGVAYLIWRERTTATAAAAAAPASSSSTGDASGTGTSADAGDAFPWDGTYGDSSDPYSMDTSSGETYGDEGFGGGGGGGGDGTSPTGPPFSTDAQWSQYAIQQLTSLSNVNPGPLTEALGLYLEGQKVTAAQKDYIDEAIGIAGSPPVSGPGNYPPSIRLSEPAPGGKTYAKNPITGLKAESIQDTDVTLSWKESPHATYYTIKVSTGKTSGTTQNSTSPTSHVGGLKAGTKYTVTVLANPARSSARPATVSFTTKGAPGKTPPPTAHKCPKGMVWNNTVKQCVPAKGYVGPG